MKLQLVTAPTSEPVSLIDAKSHMRVEIDTDDALITKFITVARRYSEKIQARAYITQTWDWFLDEFPSAPFDIPLPPLQSITSIKYFDKDETEFTFASSKYQQDKQGFLGRVTLKFGESWPSDTLRPVNGVVVRFVAGYGNNGSDVPEEILTAIKILIAHWYENRQITDVLKQEQIPLSAHDLLQIDRVFSI
jgi:uncharacterized phiE125 gp8 family phage protein